MLKAHDVDSEKSNLKKIVNVLDQFTKHKFCKKCATDKK